MIFKGIFGFICFLQKNSLIGCLVYIFKYINLIQWGLRLKIHPVEQRYNFQEHPLRLLFQL